jgi:hypothetical protein
MTIVAFLCMVFLLFRKEVLLFPSLSAHRRDDVLCAISSVRAGTPETIVIIAGDLPLRRMRSRRPSFFLVYLPDIFR